MLYNDIYREREWDRAQKKRRNDGHTALHMAAPYAKRSLGTSLNPLQKRT